MICKFDNFYFLSNETVISLLINSGINGLNVYMNADGDAEGNFTVSSFIEIEKGRRSLQPVAYFVQEPNKVIPVMKFQE